MLKMVYPWRIVPIHADCAVAWTGPVEYDTVSDAMDAVRAADASATFTAQAVHGKDATVAQWADLVVRESYEYAAFGMARFRAGADHRIAPYPLRLAREGWRHAGLMLGRYRLDLAIHEECPEPRWMRAGYALGREARAVVRSENLDWGFYGVWSRAYVHQYDTDARAGQAGSVPPPSLAWAYIVDQALDRAPDRTGDAVRAVLDMPAGRHIAEAVEDRMCRESVPWKKAVDACVHCVAPAPRDPPRRTTARAA